MPLDPQPQDTPQQSFIEPVVTDNPPPARKKGRPVGSKVERVIHWTEAEYGEVVDRLREIRARKTQRFEIDIVKAMAILPAGRRRPVSSALRTAVSKRVAALIAYEKTEEGKAATSAAAAAVVAATPASAAADTRPAETQAFAAAAAIGAGDEIPLPPGESLVHELTITIASIFAGALAQPTVKEAIKGLLRDVMGGVQPDQPDPLDFRWHDPVQIPGTERKRLLRVLVGGIIGPQMQTLANRFGKQFDLRFWSVDKSSDQLRHMSDKADVTIGFINFIGHQHEQIMKTRSKQYIRCTGGMARLSEMIEKLPTQMSMN